MTNILSHFPGTPRPQQRQVLLELEQCWSKYDVFVIESPVGAGKSFISATLAEWLEAATILTPTNILLQQYEKMFPEFAYLFKRKLYNDKSKAPKENEAAYRQATRNFLTSSIRVCNYYMFISMTNIHKLRSNTIIIDEAHNTIPTLTDLMSEKIWKYKWNYPDTIRTESDIIEWIDSLHLESTHKLAKVAKSMSGSKPQFIFERTKDFYRGELRELIKARPISVRNYKPVLWPWFVKKIVMMSATFNHKDIEELGLDKKRIKYITTGSPIPPSSRPIVYNPQGKMSLQAMPTTLPKIVRTLTTYIDNFQPKGLIHTTYSISKKLMNVCNNDRILWHNRVDKKTKYEEFLQSTDKVLMACGLAEGIDLPKDLGRWQIIMKVPFPSLTDSAINAKMEQDPEWYAWETIRAILQASGRICRTPTDFGVTIITDESFGYLYKKYNYLFPDWFKEAFILK